MPQLLDTDLQRAVEDAAAHLYVWSLKDIPQDLRDALSDARARETSVAGKRVLETIHRNVNIADTGWEVIRARGPLNEADTLALVRVLG